MEYNTFFAGVNPGGLRTKQEIKVLICYILAEMADANIKKSDVTAVLQSSGLANYFEASEAFSELNVQGNIAKKDEDLNFYMVTESGKMIAEQLEQTLPLTVKEKALANTKTYLERIKNEQENNVIFKKNERGYSVTCTVSSGEFDLLSLTLYAPDIDAVSTVKNNFYDDPGEVYQHVLSMLTKNNRSIV